MNDRGFGPHPAAARPTVGLILPGGGARGAYQVGVLAGIAELFGPSDPVPFPVIVGTSAGAMTAAYLASAMANFRAATTELEGVWSNLTVSHVYHAGYRKILGVMLRWMWSLISGGLGESNPRSLLDNSPLRELLADHIDFPAIGRWIEEDRLRGLAITVAGYSSERSLTYFQAAPGVQSWWRERREGRPARITLDHVMASLSLPIVFPAVRIGAEWCGDGSTRQFAPLSPAIHLGADRLLIVDTQHRLPFRLAVRESGDAYPSLSRIGGYLLDTIFSDSLHMDLERADRINRSIAHSSPGVTEPGAPKLRRIDSLLISPSQRPARIAEHHVAAMPKAIRWLLRSLGDGERGGDLLLSYLLFEGVFARELLELGRRDAHARAEELRRFFGLGEKVAGAL